MPCIHKLGLTMEDPYLGGIFFDHVTLPMLDHFQVSCSRSRLRNEIWPQASFLALLSRSSCSLKTLLLQRVDISTIQLLECLRALPLLVELRIKFTRLQCAATICDALGNTAQDLVPMLEELELLLYNDLEEFKNPLVTMLESRRSSPSRTLRIANIAGTNRQAELDVLVAQRLI